MALTVTILLLLSSRLCPFQFLLYGGSTGVGVSAFQSNIMVYHNNVVPTVFNRKTRIKFATRDAINSNKRSEEDDFNGGNIEQYPVTSNTSSQAMAMSEELLSMQAQAAKLREEAKSLQLALQQEKKDKIQREREKVDRWIEELLIESKVNENTELLKTVDQVLERLMEDRYSAEQVNRIFKRLCEIRTQESRSNCSPLMSLLVDASCKLDCIERENNPNKRWNHKVERLLQKKLFARDWNIELDEDDEDSGNPWKLR
ncbi:hypothetical protein IV203_022411 [Nitzschia inconspicua]|uniref:Uncharacterized protein n=1 Tax=Nitzschia inconspicua TaxID=303405 RepID=A0A9K3KKC0_9STRA|nr:hypothetical protein IV203_022411 [Nitzschia inconspicua]